MAERTTPGSTVALTVGVSDASGATGVLADLKTFSVLKVHGAAAITAVQASNTRGAGESQSVDAAQVRGQIEAVANDFEVKATKVSGPTDATAVKETARAIQKLNLFPLVVDPGFARVGSAPAVDGDAIKALCDVWLPLAALVTPNGAEAAAMLGREKPVGDPYEARTAAAEIRNRFGAAACVVTGFRRENDQEGEAVDVLVSGDGEHELVSDWRPTDNTLGAGGVFSAAITAGLALGQPIDQALQTAKQVVSESIRQTTDLGHGTGPVNVLAFADIG